MRSPFVAAVLMVGAIGATGATAAKILVATRPGTMCTWSKPLADLTLPDGSSRAAKGLNADAALRDSALGGCQDITPGMRVTVLETFRNTSIVTYDGDSRRGYGVFIAPNIDFKDADAAGPAEDPPCFNPDKRVTLSGQLAIAKGYGPPGFGKDPAHDHRYDYPLLKLDAPVCVTKLGGRRVTEQQVGLMPIWIDASLIGTHVSVTGDIGEPDNGNQPPRALLLFDSTVTPVR